MRHEILRNSIRLFVRNGFNATTVQEITDSVGVSKGAFYWYFKSKDELLNTIIEDFERTFIDELIRTVLESEGNSLHKLRHAHKYATDFAASNRDLCIGFMTMAAEMVGSKTEAETKIKSIYAKYQKFHEILIDEGKTQGLIREDIPTGAIAHVVNAIHNGSLLEWYLYHGEIDAREFAIAYREVIFNGIELRKKET
jgi:TetR/AcrR family transcriptional regulator, cholesterol catabolism regulator